MIGYGLNLQELQLASFSMGYLGFAFSFSSFFLLLILFILLLWENFTASKSSNFLIFLSISARKNCSCRGRFKIKLPADLFVMFEYH